jgi:hypothetical protein
MKHIRQYFFCYWLCRESDKPITALRKAFFLWIGMPQASGKSNKK